MVASKFKERTKEGKPRNFREILNFGSVCLVQIFDKEIDDSDYSDANCLVTHIGRTL